MHKHDQNTKNEAMSLAEPNPVWRASPETGHIMAKGQMRSSKEIRKPKKDKAEAKAAPSLGSAVKQLETNPFQKKTKK